MLGLVLTFVSITIPIQLEGTYITLFWASEMVLLLWLYVKSKVRIYEWFAILLVGLTFISFLMDVVNDGMWYSSSATIFFNSDFATALFVGLASLAFAWLMSRYREVFAASRYLNYTPWNAIMYLVGAAVIYYTFMTEFTRYLDGAREIAVMQLFHAGATFILCYVFRKRFPISQYAMVYLPAIGLNVAQHLLSWDIDGTVPMLLKWVAVGFVIANLYEVARRYYHAMGQQIGFTTYLNVLAVLLWVSTVHSFLYQLGVDDFNAGFSIALSIAGLVQMSLGMRLHQKVLRMISLVVFGIVLLKLVFVDLWAMPTIGKIIVFIILGIILLVLSFLYQRLKDVLFKNDDDETA
jgi:hypothetical protein